MTSIHKISSKWYLPYARYIHTNRHCKLHLFPASQITANSTTRALDNRVRIQLMHSWSNQPEHSEQTDVNLCVHSSSVVDLAFLYFPPQSLQYLHANERFINPPNPHHPEQPDHSSNVCRPCNSNPLSSQ